MQAVSSGWMSATMTVKPQAQAQPQVAVSYRSNFYYCAVLMWRDGVLSFITCYWLILPLL